MQGSVDAVLMLAFRRSAITRVLPTPRHLASLTPVQVLNLGVDH